MSGAKKFVRITPDGGRSFEEFTGIGYTTVVKSANETVTNSITLQDDNDLSFAVEANSTYQIIMALKPTPESVADGSIRAKLITPSDASGALLINGSNTNTSTTNSIPRGIPITGGASGMMYQPYDIPELYVTGTITTTSAGTVKLQWAQGAIAPDTPSVLKSGSYISYLKIA
jgi:hypothetical protein